MLEEIRLRDFQRHGSLWIKLDPRITVLVGDSDAGKSAVIRAFRWLCFNRPAGSGFVRGGSTRCRVGVKVDGRTVVREKGKGVNSYKLDGRPYAAFGAGVPGDIAVLLNVSDTAFALQHDAAFWFSLTPGEVARRLNRIVDLGLIDDVTGRIAARLRRARVEVEVTEDRLGKAREEKEGLSFVPALVKDVGVLEGKRADADDKASRAARAAELVVGVSEHRDRRRRARGAAGATRGVVEAGDKVKASSVRAGALAGLVGEVRRQMDAKVESYNRLGEAEASLKEELDGRCPLCGGAWKGGTG